MHELMRQLNRPMHSRSIELNNVMYLREDLGETSNAVAVVEDMMRKSWK